MADKWAGNWISFQEAPFSGTLIRGINSRETQVVVGPVNTFERDAAIDLGRWPTPPRRRGLRAKGKRPAGAQTLPVIHR